MLLLSTTRHCVLAELLHRVLKRVSFLVVQEIRPPGRPRQEDCKLELTLGNLVTQ